MYSCLRCNLWMVFPLFACPFGQGRNTCSDLQSYKGEGALVNVTGDATYVSLCDTPRNSW